MYMVSVPANSAYFMNWAILLLTLAREMCVNLLILKTSLEIVVMLGSGRALGWGGADKDDRGWSAGSLGGGIGPSAGQRARARRLAVRVLRAGVD